MRHLARGHPIAVALIVCALLMPGTAPAAPPEQANIVIPNGTISGTVWHGADEVGSMDVLLWKQGSDGRWTPWGVTRTHGFDGLYQFGLLTDGTYRVGTFGGRGFPSGPYGEAYYSADYDFDDANNIVIIDGSDHTGVDLHLISCMNDMSGDVAGEGGGPLSSFDALALRASDDRVRIGQGASLHSGVAWTLHNAGAGDYRVFLHSDGYKGVWYPGTQSKASAQVLHVTEGATLEGLDATLTMGATRLYDADRYATATWAQKYFKDSMDGMQTAVLASGEDGKMVDALAAGGLCGAYGHAPLYLTGSTSVPTSVKRAIANQFQSTASVEILVVGGTASIPQARLDEIEDFVAMQFGTDAHARISFRRISGANRYSTAVAIYNEMVRVIGAENMPKDCFIVNGADPAKWFDALAVSPISAEAQVPVFLVAQNSVPDVTRSALATYTVSNIDDRHVYVAGGPATISNGVMDSLGINSSFRKSGATRYDTAIAIANLGVSKSWFSDTTDVFVAAKLPDALAGGSLGRGPVLLTPSTERNLATLQWINDAYMGVGGKKLRDCYILGGPASVSKTVETNIDFAATAVDF